MLDWLCKRNLKVISLCWTAEMEREYSGLYARCESALLTCVDSTVLDHLPNDQRLCDKVSEVYIDEEITIVVPSAAPGKHLHNLRSVETVAGNCSQTWLLELLQCNPALNTLRISRKRAPLSPNWFEETARLCQNLQELQLFSLCTAIGDSALWSIAAHCRLLRRLHLSYYSTDSANAEVGEAPMIAVAQSCKLLERVYVGSGRMTQAAVFAICKNCRHLTWLNVPGASLSVDELLYLLPQHRKQPVTDLECRWVLQQESEVHACAALFSGLARNRYLSHFDIKHTSTDSGDDGLLRGVSDDAVLAVAERCRHLHSVHIEYSDITDAALAALGTQCLKLRCVQIHHCPLVTEAGFTQLAATSPRLLYLQILHPEIDSAAAARIRGANARHLGVPLRGN
jgi:hypothetical protein